MDTTYGTGIIRATDGKYEEVTTIIYKVT
jgi:hypothetical protein